jgi:citrate synthase
MTTRGATYTELAGSTADRIDIRGTDLVSELMGKLTFTEMFLFHLLGRRPTSLQVKIADAVLVAIMEHGLVPSVIASRLTLLGAPESYQGAIAAGLLGVGDRFAGTASRCAIVLDEIVAAAPAERAQAAAAAVQAHRARHIPLPGFGHPTHRESDPRVAKLIEIARAAGAQGQYIEALGLLETAVTQSLGRPIPTNVSSAIAAGLREAGIPAQAIRGAVLTARCAGLVGHLLEESTNPAADAMWKAVEREIPYQHPQR